MGILRYDSISLKEYCHSLQVVSALSALFSDNDIPLINYRATENIYCKSFNAINLSRFDIAIDAKIDDFGIGIKTFISKEIKSLQKIAEFNKEHSNFINLNSTSLVFEIARLRNIRLDFARNTYALNKLVYHCIARNEKGLHIFEEEMHNINIDKIRILGTDKTGVTFEDDNHTYRFNKSKSTLYMFFEIKNIIADVNVVVMEDPLLTLKRIDGLVEGVIDMRERLILPLYSQRNGTKKVFEKSGLNQWNASGRVRNSDEVYIPIPSYINVEFDGFFPTRDTSFLVNLPNGKVLSMKVCQDGNKAIMSNPNKDLGNWILRDVLKLEPDVVVTYETLEAIGIDSVEFEKLGNEYVYNLNFCSLGSFERFMDEISDY